MSTIEMGSEAKFGNRFFVQGAERTVILRCAGPGAAGLHLPAAQARTQGAGSRNNFTSDMAVDSMHAFVNRFVSSNIPCVHLGAR